MQHPVSTMTLDAVVHLSSVSHSGSSPWEQISFSFPSCYTLAVASNKRATRCSAAPPPAGVGRRMERNRKKLVGWDKGSLLEQRSKGTVTMIQIRRKHKTKLHNPQSCSHRPLLLRAPKPRVSSRCPAPPPPESSMMVHGMEHPALFGQVGSSRPAVSLSGFW